MFITKKHLPRRTFLQGLGATLALPLLDAMVPARTLLAKTAASPAPRLGFVYVPHGAIMDQWTPATEGAGFEFTPILKPLEPFRDYVDVVSGLGHRAADTTAVHSLSPTTWLSGVRPKPTQGVDAYAGVTADQIAARKIGQDTPLPSIELATEDQSGLIGACDRDYGCIYMNTLSWRTPTTPMPMEINPRKVFERMFGQGGSARGAAARHGEDRSILDAVTQQIDDLQRSLGRNDSRDASNDYLESVREIERRLQVAGTRAAGRELDLPPAPVGIPFKFEEHIKLMYDLGARLSGQHHARVHVHGGARGEQPDLSAGRRPRRAPRDVAPPEPAGEDREAREDPDVPHRAVRRVPPEARTTSRTATARCSITR